MTIIAIHPVPTANRLDAAETISFSQIERPIALCPVGTPWCVHHASYTDDGAQMCYSEQQIVPSTFPGEAFEAGVRVNRLAVLDDPCTGEPAHVETTVHVAGAGDNDMLPEQALLLAYHLIDAALLAATDPADRERLEDLAPGDSVKRTAAQIMQAYEIGLRQGRYEGTGSDAA